MAFKTKLIIEGQYIRIILSPNLVGFSYILIRCITYKYWNSENNVTIFRVGDVTEHGISLQD